MSETLTFDLETDNFLDKVTRTHCLGVVNSDTEEGFIYHDDPRFEAAGSLTDGLQRLSAAGTLIGHNLIEYDLPVLKKLYGWTYPIEQVEDTLVLSRLLFSNLKEIDFGTRQKGILLKHGAGNHSLHAWGQRIRDPKTDYKAGFEFLNQEMIDYCLQDVALTSKLWHYFKNHSRYTRMSTDIGGLTAAQWEMQFAAILFEQQQAGVKFDKDAAFELEGRLLARKRSLVAELDRMFPPDVQEYKPYPKGGPRMKMCPIRGEMHSNKLVPFRATSRQHLAERLQRDHEWVPKKLSDKGNPSMVEDILVELAEVYPHVKPFLEHTVVTARLGVLSKGSKSYFNLLKEDGCIHGRTLHVGTITHRCAHTSPNLGNVVAVKKPYGLEMRALFVPHDGMIQAGWDVDGLELRMLAHYLYPLDGGAYVEAVVSGNKEAGTEPHSLHAKAVSTVIPCSRDTGKTCTYAYLYGAGDDRLGATFGQGAVLGRKIRSALEKYIPGLNKLQGGLHGRKVIFPLDQRCVAVRSSHSALNSLLQSSGAVVVRYLTVVFRNNLREHGLVSGRDFIQTGHIHDEVQFSLLEQHKAAFTASADAACEQVAALLNLRVPLKITTKFGSNWAETH